MEKNQIDKNAEITYVSWGDYTPMEFDPDFGLQDEEDTYGGELLIDGRRYVRIGGHDDPAWEMFEEFLTSHFPVKIVDGPNPGYPYLADTADFGDDGIDVHICIFEGVGIYHDGVLAYGADDWNRKEVIEVVFEALGVQHTHRP